MTNNWSDMANATLHVVWGANPVENHPASIAHMNRSRFPKQFFAAGDPRANKTPATLLVIDPRKTRTALQADHYVRIRPGTDIALGNGLMKYMIETIEARGVGDSVYDKFFGFLNETSAQPFHKDGANSGDGLTLSIGTGSKYTDARFIVNGAGDDYERETLNAGTATQISNFPKKAVSVTSDPNTVFNRLKAHVAPYTLEVTADIVGCTVDELKLIGDLFIAHSRCSSGASTDPRDPAYRAASIHYAMGITQHTCGAANCKMFATIQTLLGNMGRAGGGINALRGIHNVQGSTDMGLLYGNIPAYSGNPSTQVDGGPDWRIAPATNNAFGKYMDALWGTPLSGTGGKTNMNNSYNDAYVNGQMALQQRGFYNMTLKWFGNFSQIDVIADATAKRAAVDACYSLWPKGNGDNHVKMFRNMHLNAADRIPGSPRIQAAVVWGQNPAVTEPNQGKVRQGLYDLDLLVVTDMFETETGGVSRKPGGVTFLIPAASHVEKAGSATNSGRVLQWRYQATLPAGNSKDDTELLLRFAKKLDEKGAFQHIADVWSANGISYTVGATTYTSVYGVLYEDPYKYNGVSGYNTVKGTGEKANLRKLVSDPVTYDTSVDNLVGSEWVTENVFREMCTPSGSGGTIWIYTNAYSGDRTTNRHTGQANWATANRAKSRDRQDPNGTLAFPGWGMSWLVNRRVLYNNNPLNYISTDPSTHEVPGDVNDFFMGPDSCSRLFVCKDTPVSSVTSTKVTNYSRWYRTIHKLNDVPRLENGTLPAIHVLPGRFPAHVEPYETARPDVAETFGYNSTSDAAIQAAGAFNLIYGGTTRGTVEQFPLTVTTIRCVEHFQGGPITRNNWLNVEVEPEPWIELNAVDAHKYGIKDGDMVKVITARTESLPDDVLPLYGEGFRARVGVGLQDNQRVAPGVVAIPWHWGDKGLSTGSRANDITIDAVDANTTIPEYKVALCRLEKM